MTSPQPPSRCWFYFSILTLVCVIALGAVVASISSGARHRTQVGALIHSPSSGPTAAVGSHELTRVAGGLLLCLTLVLVFGLALSSPQTPGGEAAVSSGLVEPAAQELRS